MAEQPFDWNNVFDKTSNAWMAWAAKASDLIVAADCLQEASENWKRDDAMTKFRVYGPMRMLRGMAIECQLKAMGLNQEMLHAKNGVLRFGGALQELNRQGRLHDLRQVAEAVRFKTSEEERETLDALSFYIVGGRYPAPRRATEIHDALRENPGFPWKDCYDECVQEMLSRLRHAVHPEKMNGYLVSLAGHNLATDFPRTDEKADSERQTTRKK